MPAALAEKPHLREFYGRVDFAVRAYCVGTMGWFDGNPTTLGTLAPEDEGARFIALVGGVDAVLNAVREARAKGDFQWALQLVDRVIFADQGDKQVQAKALKAEILLDYAEEQINCPTRHYYITSAKEISAASASVA